VAQNDLLVVVEDVSVTTPDMKNARAGALKRAEKKAVSLVRGHFKKIKRSTKKRGTKKKRRR
jgi:hypothetical protein